MKSETLWHVTVLSNFAKGYDKYARRYSKASLSQSTFPDQFFLLRETELNAGVIKASGLLLRLGISGDGLIALQTQVSAAELRENTRTGIGRYVERGWITLTGVARVDADGDRRETTTEEVMAESLGLMQEGLDDFTALRPRSFSVLPVARGCQASCPFCFSDASASAEQDQARLDLGKVARHASEAARLGAERFVITGGGEPGLVRHELLLKLIRAGGGPLQKAVLITNGHHLARREEEQRAQMLAEYAEAGLNVLAVSRHHHDGAVSARLMSLETDVAAVARTWRTGCQDWPLLRLRLICVLQQGGVEDMATMEAYVDWAAASGVGELCFKELYVSTSIESVYHRHSANTWSHAHQVPLSLVLDFASKHGFVEVARLPWGAPVFRGEWRGAPMQIAAYTEPSLLWERTHGIARSWNLMADGRCLVSLEDRNSEISLGLTA